MTMRRIFASLCLAMLLAGVVIAQEKKAEPAQPSAQEQPATQEKKEGEKPAAHEKERGPGFGKQLAEESREAAGEVGENSEFKLSSSVKWVAKTLGISASSASLLLFILNFAVIAAAIVWFSKSQLPQMFRARTQAIRKSMDEAQAASEDAKRRLSDIEARLARLDTEIAAMKGQADTEAKAEEERIRAAAEADVRKVIENAEQEIAAAAKVARRDLKAFTAELAVGLAEQRIRIEGDTDQALVRSFVDQLGRDGH